MSKTFCKRHKKSKITQKFGHWGNENGYMSKEWSVRPVRTLIGCLEVYHML